MRRSLAGAASVAAALVGLVVLAGCGSDPKAEPSPSPSTPSVSTTPSPTAPTMPAAASENSKAGAIAFVRYYIAVFNDAQSTGQTDVLEELSAPECGDCRAATDGLKQLYANGGEIVGGSLRPGPATAAHNDAEKKWLILIRVDSGPQSVKPAANAEPKQMPGGRRSMEFTVRHEADGWKVQSWVRA